MGRGLCILKSSGRGFKIFTCLQECKTLSAAGDIALEILGLQSGHEGKDILPCEKRQDIFVNSSRWMGLPVTKCDNPQLQSCINRGLSPPTQ